LSVLGYSGHTLTAREGWRCLVFGILAGGWLAPPVKKEFKPKFALKKLDNYKKNPGGEFWENFPCNKNLDRPDIINAGRMIELATEVGSEDWDRLWKVCKDVKYGANIGCQGVARAPTMSGNAPNSFEFGPQVTDAVADWLHKNFAAGPFLEEEVPAAAKISGIMCREKPNGAVRIILNLSAPKGASVNDGIDKYEFPAKMSSTQQWLKVLEKAGKGCNIAKIDWSDPYKHLGVREEDRNLQWFSWLGRYFVEKCLIFGASSSVGLYDRLAKTVLDLVIRRAKFPKDMVCQHLDDVCAAAPATSDLLSRFDNEFMVVANEIGVKLAPRDDPEKSFGPSKKGTVFGVEYDTESWTWGIPREKMAKIACQIRILLDSDETRQDEIQSVVGRIINVRPLVLDGRFHMDHLMALVAVSERGADLVALTPGFKRQLHFWYVMLRACSGRAAIPAPEDRLPPWAVDCFTDAAGGTLEGAGRGVGVVVPATGGWWYMPWSKEVNNGSWVTGGKKMSRKMSALELVGPLLAVVGGAAELRGLAVRIWVDNSGSCNIWKRGYSNSCKISTTLVKAIAAVGAALGCRLDICKIDRCSNAGTEMADALSKADFRRFRAAGGATLNVEPGTVPLQLLSWAAGPVADDELASRLLRELALTHLVLGYNC